MDTPTYKVPSSHAATPDVLPSERHSYINPHAALDILETPEFLKPPADPKPDFTLIYPVNEAFLSGGLPMPHGVNLLPSYRYILRLIGVLGLVVSSILFLRALPDFLGWLSVTNTATLDVGIAIAILAFVVGLPLYLVYTIVDRNGEEHDRAKFEATIQARGVVCDGKVLHAYLTENDDGWSGKLIYEATTPNGSTVSEKQMIEALEAEIGKRLVPGAALKVLCIGDTPLCVL